METDWHRIKPAKLYNFFCADESVPKSNATDHLGGDLGLRKKPCPIYRLVTALFSVTFRCSIVTTTQEIQRRRTFAIISHPDAGKTTVTEKLLLYGGAVQLAGSVTARKNQRANTSDWMELEK